MQTFCHQLLTHQATYSNLECAYIEYILVSSSAFLPVLWGKLNFLLFPQISLSIDLSFFELFSPKPQNTNYFTCFECCDIRQSCKWVLPGNQYVSSLYLHFSYQKIELPFSCALNFDISQNNACKAES